MFIYATLIVLSIYLLKAFRWKILMHGQNIHYSFKDSFLSFTSSNFIAFITPGRIGEFAKVFYLKEDMQIPFSKSIPNVITDRLFDVYSLLFWGLSGFIYMKLNTGSLTLLIIILTALLPLLFFIPKIYNLTFIVISKVPFVSGIVSKRGQSIENMRNEFQKLINMRLVFALCISAISYFVLFLAAYFLSRSVNIELKFAEIISIVSVANILSFLPITVSGLGTREAVFIFFLSKLQYSTEQALLFSTVFFACFYIVGGLFGYLCFMAKPVNIGKLKREIK